MTPTMDAPTMMEGMFNKSFSAPATPPFISVATIIKDVYKGRLPKSDFYHFGVCPHPLENDKKIFFWIEDQFLALFEKKDFFTLEKLKNLFIIEVGLPIS